MKECFGATADFLEEFKKKGFFLDDLVLYLINQIQDKNERNEHWRKGVSSLARRMADYRPTAVVALTGAIEPMVADAMREAGLHHVPRNVTPFPPRTPEALQGENDRDHCETSNREAFRLRRCSSSGYFRRKHHSVFRLPIWIVPACEIGNGHPSGGVSACYNVIAFPPRRTRLCLFKSSNSKSSTTTAGWCLETSSRGC
jgi:hypothetical protein